MKKSKIGQPLPMLGLPPEAGEQLGHAGPAASGLNLANHFLIAMPSMDDPVFGGTVVYVCEHNDKGVLGVIVNKPTDMTMETLFERIDLKLADNIDDDVVNEAILFGGPVQDDRGFVLHTPGDRYSSSLTVTPEVAFTTSIDVLEAVAAGRSPWHGWEKGCPANTVEGQQAYQARASIIVACREHGLLTETNLLTTDGRNAIQAMAVRLG